MKYATTSMELFTTRLSEEYHSEFRYEYSDEELGPFPPDFDYGSKWELINTCVNESKIFWTWKLLE